MNDLLLHHAGYVVRSITEAAQDFVNALGASWDERTYHDPLQKVNVTFLQLGRGAAIELIEAVGEDSPVRRFSEHGGGLHHLCYEVANLEEHVRRMRSQGVLLVKPPLPAVAFEGRRIAWMMSKQRLLLEFLEAGGPLRA